MFIISLGYLSTSMTRTQSPYLKVPWSEFTRWGVFLRYASCYPSAFACEPESAGLHRCGATHHPGLAGARTPAAMSWCPQQGCLEQTAVRTGWLVSVGDGCEEVQESEYSVWKGWALSCVSFFPSCQHCVLQQFYNFGSSKACISGPAAETLPARGLRE